ncbi:MAG: fumarylacetoacetate hydrolase family protein, partial [Melioribacteraceae bacterium]|nr:fumarylacetoacetate hydrolase family protein [Melioribacteraceae bacterium]
MKTLKIKNSDEEINVGKIVCVGRNYAAHAAEMGNQVLKFPLIFLKTSTCLISSGGNIIHPNYSEDLHHEIELVLLIGEKVKNANDEEAENSIAGYAVGLDMTLRDIQAELKSKGHPWTLAKVFDTSAVISEIILKKDYKLKGDEKIYLNVNEHEKQSSTLDKMLFSSIEIVKYISSKMTLEEGDLIYTGTPSGVSKVVKGDRLTGGIEHI